MHKNDYLFSSESVSEGHPDKICDQISDSILDYFIAKDPKIHMACETFATTNQIIVGGEMSFSTPDLSMHWDDITDAIEKIVRTCVRTIGYEQEHFHWQDIKITNLLHAQSKDIEQAVRSDDESTGAGDQGLMFGYAVDETPALMPVPIFYAHAILRHLSEARKAGLLSELGPDAKTQLTVRYHNGQPCEIMSLVLSTQHYSDALTPDHIRDLIAPYVRAVVPPEWLKNTCWLVNPSGKFVVGGPNGDAGLTGRKIVVDTYGGAAPHGGGAFSGKDPSKVDRSAAYAARYLAKNIVAAGLAKRCLIQLSYAIGKPQPVSIYVHTEGTGKTKDDVLTAALPKMMGLTPHQISTELNLLNPIFARTAAYGHFGREPDKQGGFSWEKTDLVPQLHALL